MVKQFIRHNVFTKQESNDYEKEGSGGGPTEKPTNIPLTVYTTDLESDDYPSPTYSPYPGYAGYSHRPSINPYLVTSTSEPPSTLATSTSKRPGPYSDNLGTTTSSMLLSVTDNGGLDPTSTNASGNKGGDQAGWQQHGPPHTLTYAMAGIIPVVVLAIIGAVVFFCLRNRKRQRRQKAAAQAQMQELKARNRPLVSAHYMSHPPSPPPPAQPQYAIPPPQQPSSTTPTMPPPVILGPIGSASNGAYFTGLDTSDVVSVHDRTGLGNPFADGDSLNGEEPPPPYRPRSVAISSRNSSMRAPPSFRSEMALIPPPAQAERSPFDDPDGDDDAISDISGPISRRHHDNLSVVSDMSYQEEPVVTTRPTI